MEPISKLWPVPRDLTGEGRKFYQRVGKILVAEGRLCDMQKAAFIHMCKAHHIVTICQAEIDQYGINIPSPQQGFKKNPAAAVKKSEEETLIKYFMYFGIVNKDGIELEKPKKENKKEKFFKVA